MARDAWTTLGIDPTDDLRAIRGAYVARLKEIDVEADPKAFIALRDAFERIKRLDASLAQSPAMAGGVAWEAPSSSSAAADRTLSPATDALERLLHSESTDRLASMEEAEAMLAHWRAIVADPRIDTLGYYGSVEMWASALIADAAPFSDPLVLPAVEYFGWVAQEGDVHARPFVAQVLRQYRILCPRAELAEPGHYLFAGWRDRNQPPNPMDLLNWSALPYARSDKPREVQAYVFGDLNSFTFSPNSTNRVARRSPVVRRAPVGRPARPPAVPIVAAIGALLILAILAVLALRPVEWMGGQ